MLSSTCRNYPNTIRLLETEVYSRRKKIKGMSQYALADKVGVTRNCIQQIEAYEHLPKVYTVFDIIMALGFQEEERNLFAIKFMEAYYLDKKLQEERASREKDA